MEKSPHKTIRLTRITVRECIANPDFYWGEQDPVVMAEMEANQADDLELWHDAKSESVYWTFVADDGLPQRQDGLMHQLNDLILLAEQHQMHDAADYLRQKLEKMNTHQDQQLKNNR